LVLDQLDDFEHDGLKDGLEVGRLRRLAEGHGRI
jgi:hypothetical protein